MGMEQWWNDTDRGNDVPVQNLYSEVSRFDGWVWSKFRMVLTGETEVLREIFLIFCGWWMEEYGELMELFLKETEIKGEKNVECEW